MQCPYPVSIRNPKLDENIGYSVDSEGNAISLVTGEIIPPRLDVPCGRCVICRENRRNIWADRLELESRDSVITYFVTLTYNDENCPDQLCKSDLQKFFKRLRHRYNCRFFACGEYGDRFQRPHYHACIFLKEMVSQEVFEEVLREKWPFGFIMARVADREAFRYVSKYTIKYLRESPNGVEPPFALMSRRPGISASYSDNFENYFYEYIVLANGERRPLPSYLESKLDPVCRIRLHELRKEYATSQNRLTDSDKYLRLVNLERSLQRKYLRKYGK